ncbi:hypothetical protein AB1Y20_021176 [Prymnesium parvum]|uniref:5'-3' exoribonuclease 2 n=1 Tax=Prymnesium parvum TaxID=97485 RepID=A0AB34JJD9_PRYPA
MYPTIHPSNAFFKWLAQKYPKIVVDCVEDRATWSDTGEKIPINTSRPNPNGLEYDNLFLDMNGIIHPAAHPEDRPPPETEDDMYLAIFAYLERVFAAVRPRKLLYMAIDGVAPRAKMNQQRSRRFRSAQEAEEKEEEEARLREAWAAQGREVPLARTERPFDSNTITPGTPFMDRLAVFLRAFVHKKLSTDPGWRNIKVILSDGSVPGEGEHKIMEYIRSQRYEPGYSPNTRHAIHGLDADLIMLSLATHEPHFSILREYVGPTGQRKGGISEQVQEALEKAASEEADGGMGRAEEQKAAPPTPFQFLHIGVLREYLDKEFRDADYSAAPEGYELERVLDDFIFLCFFVGNDFLPHLPSLEIREGAIDTLCDLYRKNFGELGGWICDGGTVDLARAKVFCEKLGQLEDELLMRHRLSEEREKGRRRRRDSDVKGRVLESKHRDMLQRLSETAMVPRASQHVQSMQGRGGASSRDDEALFEIFNMIRAFAALPDNAPQQKLPSHLNGFQRAMAYQYCEELGVANKNEGTEPNRCIVMFKQDDANETAATKFKRQLSELIKQKNTLPEEEDQIQLGAPGWKKRYYDIKFAGLHEEDRVDVALKYAEGLCWVMRYYYDGCPSWKWYFPYHYAPFAADIAAAIDPAEPFEFELGEPFLPFQQLMGVLPPRSADALPAAICALMRDPSSEISDFYPVDFAIDLNGKKFAWQAVVLLPFIDETRLVEAMAEHEGTFTAEERRRNSHGPTLVFASESHALFPAILKAQGPPPTEVTLTPELGAELAGVLRVSPDPPRPGEIYVVPDFRGKEEHDALQDFRNVSGRAVFIMPQPARRRPTLLPGCDVGAPMLQDADVPQLGRFLSAGSRPAADASAAQRMAQHHLPSNGMYSGPAGHSYSRAPHDTSPVDVGRVNALLSQREQARRQRQFDEADHLRGVLHGMGVELDDDHRLWRVRPQMPHLAHPHAAGPAQHMPYDALPPHLLARWANANAPPRPMAPRPPAGPLQLLRQGQGGPQRNVPQHDLRHHPYQQPPAAGWQPPPHVGVAHHQAAALLRQQLAAGGVPTAMSGNGYPPGGVPVGLAPPQRPAPPAGAPTNANKSAADLLRAQLMGRK